jgi:molecular chaperone DnaK
MVKDAESHADEDKKRREVVEAKNQCEALVHSSEKALAEYGDKVGADDKAAIETAIADLKTALEGNDKAEIEEKSQALATVSMKLGEAMYADSQAEADASDMDEPAEPTQDDDVVDADFEDVDDEDQKKAS